MSLFFPSTVKVAGNSSFANQLADKIIRELTQFPNLKDRLRIYSETEKYNWKEDESVWKQKRELAPEEGEVYMDREFISPYNAKDGINKAYVRFLQELGKLYLEGKIFVHPEVYEVKRVEQEMKDAAAKPLEVPTPRNEIEGMIVESIKTSAKKRKRKVKMI